MFIAYPEWLRFESNKVGEIAANSRYFRVDLFGRDCCSTKHDEIDRHSRRFYKLIEQPFWWVQKVGENGLVFTGIQVVMTETPDFSPFESMVIFAAQKQ